MTDERDQHLNRPGEVRERIRERLAVVEAKTHTLEENLPRIGALENGMTALSTRIETVSQDIHEIQQDGHRTVVALRGLQEQHTDLSTKISKLFWTGTGAMMLVAAVAGAVSFLAGLTNIDGWIERTLQHSNPPDVRPLDPKEYRQ